MRRLMLRKPDLLIKRLKGGALICNCIYNKRSMSAVLSGLIRFSTTAPGVLMIRRTARAVKFFSIVGNYPARRARFFVVGKFASAFAAVVAFVNFEF